MMEGGPPRRGGENRGMERPNGNREIGPRLGTDYGKHGQGFVEGDEKWMLGRDKLSRPPGPKRAGNVVGGRKKALACESAGSGNYSGGNPWMSHLKAYRAKHPKLSMSQAMQGAKKTYKKR